MKTLCVSMALAALLLAAGVSAEEAQAPAAQAPAEGTPAAPQAAVKELSMYGEVKAVTVAANTLSVQYYDYDSDEEKTAEVVIDQNTKIENAAGLNEIKQGDWVDVTYTVVEARNIAKTVVVEKEEEIAPDAEGAAAPEAPEE